MHRSRRPRFLKVRNVSHSLQPLATRVLTAYDLEVTSVAWIAEHTNALFRVETASQGAFALRVGLAPEIGGGLHVPSEIAWLRALVAAGLPVVRPVSDRNGAYVAHVTADGSVRACVLFEWIDGDELSEKVTPDAIMKVGDLMARMHDHAETFVPPADFRPLRWDRVFYYPAEPVVWHASRYAHVVTRERAKVLKGVIAKAGAELARLHQHPPIVVHGDLHPGNLLVCHGQLVALDFEDTMWAQPVQDVATALHYLRDEPDPSALRAAFEAGYTAHRSWPVEYDGQLELLMAARQAMFVNYVLRTGTAPMSWVENAIASMANVLP